MGSGKITREQSPLGTCRHEFKVTSQRSRMTVSSAVPLRGPGHREGRELGLARLAGQRGTDAEDGGCSCGQG